MLDEAQVRQEKLHKLIALGIDPYPATTGRTATVGETLTQFDELSSSAKPVTLAGRLMTTRVMGALIFADLVDESGRLQILLKEENLNAKSFAAFRDLVDPGDYIEATGTLFTTKRGEKTLQVSSWKILVKALLPLPDKFHGLQDVELRFRKRYLDLLMNADTGERLRKRSSIVRALRAFMNRQGFLEVETPTLQPIYGGGFARPFKTHHHALDADFFLRISDEMYLKRLLVGGMEKVYEITKVFRNEGIDRDHNPEFTMFEAQAAYRDYRWGMDFFEELFESVAKDALGTTSVKHGDATVELKRPWQRYSMVEAVRKVGGVDVKKWKTAAAAKKELEAKVKDRRKKEDLARLGSVGECIAFAFEELVEEKLIQPTIVYDYPVEVSPLAKKSGDPKFTERFEVFALGSEIGNNYSELNDPLDLEARFVAEKKKEAAGFEEAHQTDEDYLEAIRHGMPPSCGLGIGVDRMAMLLTGADNIKEVILFPTLRPREK